MLPDLNKSELLQKIASIENLILAWRRIESSFQHGNVWYDEIDLAKFKFRMLENIRAISKQLLEGNYQLHSIVPAPFPKCCDENGHLQVRQSFLIHVADQVVWMAVVNIIGRDFERKMPAWSYGNRLDIPVWKEDKKWKFGDIRTTSKSLYRSWSRSWPLYRKQLTATIKKMAFSVLSDEDEKVVDENVEIEGSNDFLKLPYLEENYFTGSDGANCRDLYWVGLDLSKFYQKVRMDSLCRVICSSKKYAGDKAFCALIQSITTFTVDVLNYSDEELAAIQLSRTESFTGLPTGLVVAGFLANLYLLDIDNEISEKLKCNKNVVHFRYVDDHVFVATSPRELIEWVRQYMELLNEKGLDINSEKCEPCEVRQLISENIDSVERWKVAKLDPLYPSPLMTETLQKVSALSALNIDLLTDAEFEMVFNDLQMLMVTDIPEEEIKKGTRISFTSTMLSRMVSQWNCDMEQLYQLRERWMQGVNSYWDKNPNLHEEDVKTLVNVAFANGSHTELEKLNLENLKQSCNQSADIKWQLVDEMHNFLKKGLLQEERKCKKIFSLLIKALIEVPDKTKIWIRALDFCSLHLPYELSVIFQILNKLKNNRQLHPLGHEYLFAMLIIRVSHNMIRALNRLIINNYSKPYEREHDKIFLQNAIKISLPVSSHYMIQDASLIYYKASLLYIAHQHDLNLDAYVAKNTYCSEVEYNGEQLGANFWLLWGISLLSRYVPREELNVSKLFGQFLKEMQPSDIYFMPLISYCMNELREADYRVIHFKQPLVLSSEINVFEFLYNLKYLPGGDSLEKHIQGYDHVKRLLRKSVSRSRIRLCDWLHTLPQNTDINSVYQSEYFATKLIYSIAKEIRFHLQSEIVSLHPFSIMLSRNEMTTKHDWMWWREKEMKIIWETDGAVDDSFYTYPSKVLCMSQARQVYYIYGLGMIFLQLISKRVVMPWIIYRPEFGFEWMSVLRSLMTGGCISTRNFNIIRSCLSERNRENLRMKHQDEEFEFNKLYDGNTYLSIDDLMHDLEDSITSMEANMVSVAGYHTRQLTVIDLNKQLWRNT